MVEDVPTKQEVVCPTCSKVCADLSSALAHIRAVHKCVTDERTIAAWKALGCYVCQDRHLTYKKLKHQCESKPSRTPTPPPGRGRARARAEVL